jgi:hypothetical protein
MPKTASIVAVLALGLGRIVSGHVPTPEPHGKLPCYSGKRPVLMPPCNVHQLPITDHEELDCHAELSDYNLGLAIGSVFILLGVSLLGSLAPLLLSKVKHGAIDVLIKVKPAQAPLMPRMCCKAIKPPTEARPHLTDPT